MSSDLLDVNLLVALAWPNHVHHRRARTWFRGRGERPWATTPVTESGFVRVSSNPAAIPTAVTPIEALALLDRLRAVPGHAFLADDLELVFGVTHVEPAHVVTHRMVTDAHLLALARRHGGRLATLDEGIVALAGERPDDVLIIPPQPG
ncbi:MAG TPA: TA system VapC family ribonuclease toxin [Acidimicrobiales bacterium]|nr:TA system VapC family ribonuclease toxin [Acidimicrobiales bacterium]